jgi:glycosyltransferase involved in cell wall biosynthesis
MLHLVNFDEPFGFSVVEAMACGTPVIAPRRGSMAEIIRHGENGFLADTQQDAAAAVHASSSLDRTAVRSSVEGRFDVERMVDDYLAVLGWAEQPGRLTTIPRSASGRRLRHQPNRMIRSRAPG